MMPELSMDAPALADAGARLNTTWMAAWIADPRALRPDSSMPQMLHGADAAAKARTGVAVIVSDRSVFARRSDQPQKAEDDAGVNWTGSRRL